MCQAALRAAKMAAVIGQHGRAGDDRNGSRQLTVGLFTADLHRMRSGLVARLPYPRRVPPGGIRGLVAAPGGA